MFQLKEKYGVCEWGRRFLQYNWYDRVNARRTKEEKREKKLNEQRDMLALALTQDMEEERIDYPEWLTWDMKPSGYEEDPTNNIYDHICSPGCPCGSR